MLLTERRTPSARPAAFWAAAAAVVLALLALISARERPPRAKPASIPPAEFSAARAWPVLAYLADTVGYRVAGTPGADSAVAYLVQTLQRVEGVEIQVQDVSGARGAPDSPRVLAYSVRNVLVRIPGRSRDALLLSAHYDTPPGSVGAGDDAVAVAALVEVVRALASGPRLLHTVIVNINDGEEQGLVGAHGFTQHPWIRDVRAFVNLESAGPHGKAILFQTGPGNPWLTTTYARAVPYPYGTVVAQDIFQSGAIPSDTDFRIYRDFGGLRGLDIALYQEGWAYHTQRDRTWNVSPGTVQHMGENALALARALANGPLPGNVSAERSVYYDVLGIYMLSYTARTAVLLAMLGTALGIVALAAGIARRRFRAGHLAIAFGAVIASLLVALLAALALATIAAHVLRRPMSWYSTPAPAIIAFALAALGAILMVGRGVAALFERRRTPRPAAALAVQGAVLLFWMLALAALTLIGVGSAYLALWWVAGGAAGMLYASLAREDRWWVGALVGFLPGAVLTLQLLLLLTRLFIPVFGRLTLSIAPDLVLAAMVASLAAVTALALLPGAFRAGALGRVSLGVAGLSLAALGVSLTREPYTFRRPQRLALVHEQRGDEGVVRVWGSDYRTPRLALAHAPWLRPAGDDTEPAMEFTAPARGTGFPPPRLELVSSRADEARGTRRITLRAIAPGAYRLRLHLPTPHLSDWSIPAPLPAPPTSDAGITVDYIAPPDTGWLFSMDVRGDAPLTMHLSARRYRTTEAASDIVRALPPWTDVHAVAVNQGSWTF